MKTPKYQIYCERGGDEFEWGELSLDGCWGSEHAKFSSRRKALTTLVHLSKCYPDCGWVVCSLDGKDKFDHIAATVVND